MIETKVICDSIGENAPRLTTMFWRYPKFIHQESLRHRKIYFEDGLRGDFDFSFSVSSARAIPFKKLLEEVRSDELRAKPVFWGLEKKGMSPGEEIENLHSVEIIWRNAALDAAILAQQMTELGIHKSICNRIIEPYIHVNVLATASEPGWMNFFGLRLDSAADPTLRALAEESWKIWNESEPRRLNSGEWHLPFIEAHVDLSSIDEIDKEEVLNANDVLQILIKTSVARCARLSYLSFQTGKRSTIEEDLRLYDRLVGSVPIHASPAEHQATPDIWWEAYPPVPGTSTGFFLRENEGGNLGPGWIQYRKTLPGESLAPIPEAYL